MKKNYFALLAIILLGSLTASAWFGGNTKQKSQPSSTNVSGQSLPGARQSSPNHTSSIIWTNDFSVPADWTKTHDVGTNDWVIGTTAPSGPYSISRINSTSYATGFALFDSDVLCSHNQIANLTNATAINCSGHPTVRLMFEQYYRKYYDSTFVYVSNNGTTWTKFKINTTQMNNDFSNGNPEIIKLNITSVAGNQPTVYIRFTFYSPTALGANAGCGYAWMIDDIIVDDYPVDDVAIVDKGFPSQYTEIPLLQVQPLNLSTKISNEGINAAANASVTIDIFKNNLSNNVYSNTSTVAASIASGATSVLLTAPAYTPNDTGIYFIRYVAHATATDLDHTNDTLIRFLIVDDVEYARDLTIIDGRISNLIGLQGSSFIAGQNYDIVTSVNLNAVSFYLSDAVLGDSVSVSVYSVNGAGAPNASMASSSHVINASDTGGSFISINMTTPIPLQVGQYFIAVTQVDTNYLTLGFADEINTPAKLWVKSPATSWIKADTIGFTGSFLIRPRLSSTSIGINEISIQNNIEVFPNPSKGKVNIINTGMKEKFTITVYNAMGQLVYMDKFNQFSYSTVDLSHQAAGVYTIKLENANETVTKSVVITGN